MSALAPSIDRLYSLRELSELGYGSRNTNRELIAKRAIPAVIVGNSYKIRESDLHLLAVPVTDAHVSEQIES